LFELFDMEDEDEKYESNTVGGWTTECFGEIPPIGEVIREGRLEIKVVKSTKQKVLKIRVKQLDEEEEKPEEKKTVSRVEEKKSPRIAEKV
ncbi:MAG: hypothetical protein E7368_00260, partial [Clostridiales bacterium]|nr:hypothetical protein [Clostridiales bacterium]